MKDFWQNFKYRFLQWRKRRAIKKHKHEIYFAIVKALAKIDAEKMVKEKLNETTNP